MPLFEKTQLTANRDSWGVEENFSTDLNFLPQLTLRLQRTLDARETPKLSDDMLARSPQIP